MFTLDWLEYPHSVFKYYQYHWCSGWDIMGEFTSITRRVSIFCVDAVLWLSVIAKYGVYSVFSHPTRTHSFQWWENFKKKLPTSMGDVKLITFLTERYLLRIRYKQLFTLQQISYNNSLNNCDFAFLQSAKIINIFEQMYIQVQPRTVIIN